MNAMKEKLYGNGINDDTAAIQALLDGVEREIRLPKPEKHYLISAPLQLHGGKTLVLEKDTVVRLADGASCLMLKKYKKDPVHRYPLFYFQTETRSENVTIRNVEREETDCPVPFVGAEEGADIGGVRLENIKQASRVGGIELIARI